jgi:hypothetical protein
MNKSAEKFAYKARRSRHAITTSQAVSEMACGRFVRLLPGTAEIESLDIGQFESAKFPGWFKKIQRLDFPNDRLLDHPGRFRGTDVFVAQPYWLNGKQIERLLSIAAKYALQLDMSGHSSWFPGETFCVRLTPTEQTYSTLKLKRPTPVKGGSVSAPNWYTVEKV